MNRESDEAQCNKRTRLVATVFASFITFPLKLEDILSGVLSSESLWKWVSNITRWTDRIRTKSTALDFPLALDNSLLDLLLDRSCFT